MPIPADRAQAYQLITQSLGSATRRSADLTPAIYERLFVVRPETRALFRTDPGDVIKRSMLELALDAIVDFSGERKAAHRLVLCEVQSHDCYGTTPEIFCDFFKVIADSVRETIGDEWTAEHQAAWDRLVEDLNAYAATGVRLMA